MLAPGPGDSSSESHEPQVKVYISISVPDIHSWVLFEKQRSPLNPAFDFEFKNLFFLNTPQDSDYGRQRQSRSSIDQLSHSPTDSELRGVKKLLPEYPISAEPQTLISSSGTPHTMAFIAESEPRRIKISIPKLNGNSISSTQSVSTYPFTVDSESLRVKKFRSKSTFSISVPVLDAH
ncbi:hypothetical protein L208DRAFT_1382603 [Tricholoma matsutake]|nr:hypothetical protein L208DRAFT_1382603 [Tricholoma matsutake 945]